MANRIFLIENDFYHSLDVALQAHIETACNLVPGARLKRFSSFDELIMGSEFRDGVVLVPISLPDDSNQVEHVRKSIEKNIPFSVFFAVQFLLLPEGKGFHPDILTEAEWVERLDAFYDIAVPSGFVVFFRGLPQVEAFHVASSISGLLRQIESLEELRKLSAQVSELEESVERLQK